MSFSKYPKSLDDSTTLPPSTDLVTPVKAEVTNRLRDSVLSVQSELGTLPSGTFGTVRSRLDNLELSISDLDSSVSDINNSISSINSSISDLESEIDNIQSSTPGPSGPSGPSTVTSSSTDEAIARFDGTDGYIQDSSNGPFITDSGQLTLINDTSISSRNSLDTSNFEILKLDSSDVLNVGSSNINSIILKTNSIDAVTINADNILSGNNLIIDGYLSSGLNSAQSGNIRVPHTGSISSRNSIGTGDIEMLTTNSANETVIGYPSRVNTTGTLPALTIDNDGGTDPHLLVRSSSTLIAKMQCVGTNTVTIGSETANNLNLITSDIARVNIASDGSDITLQVPSLVWNRTVISPEISQNDNPSFSVTCEDLTIHSQNGTNTGSNGGNLLLNAGNGVASGGDVNIGAGSGTTNGSVNLRDGNEADRISVNSFGNVLMDCDSLIKLRTQGDIVLQTDVADNGSGGHGNIIMFDNESTNTQSMESGIFIGDVNAEPTGNPTGGIFVWSDSGAGKARGASGTITTWATADPHCKKCGRDSALEWENKKEGWKLAICMWCVTDAINDAGVISKEQK